MKRILLPLFLLFLLLIAWPVSPTLAQGGGYYIIQPGDTLFSVANHYGISVEHLAGVNDLSPDDWVYAGQALVLPSFDPPVTANSRPTVPTRPVGADYTVSPGDTLFAIARRFGTSVPALQAANDLGPNGWLWLGQRLVIPVESVAFPASLNYAAPQPSYRPANPGAERWIDVNLTSQTVTAYEGDVPVFTTLGSTGTWRFPTVVGTFQIYVKYEQTRMYGGVGADAYDLPNVPYVMYFYQGYGLHGTYWHNNFGTPMSRGCVNLSIADAAWFYNWASVGTRVVTHY
ncbi:MAG: LysM peptidoglycan-binding domain-containing protein [Anaerolineae bacterium]|nr:LysM peptidoglycan-binding domain-containing protein [Anaerolineae bacterium]